MNRDVWQKYALELTQLQTKPIIDGSFWPTNYPLIVWYRADDVVIDDDGGVSQWNDKSGNGYHATQATPANRPTQVAGAIGSAMALNFDGANDNFDFPQLGNIHQSSLTIFIIANGNAMAQYPYLVQLNDVATTNTFIIYKTGTNHYDVYNVGVTVRGTDLMPNIGFNAAIWGATKQRAGRLTSYKDGVPVAYSDAAGAGADFTAGAGNIGTGALNPSQFWNGYIAEIIIVDGVLATADHNLFLDYFTSRYGIAHTPIV